MASTTEEHLQDLLPGGLWHRELAPHRRRRCFGCFRCFRHEGGYAPLFRAPGGPAAALVDFKGKGRGSRTNHGDFCMMPDRLQNGGGEQSKERIEARRRAHFGIGMVVDQWKHGNHGHGLRSFDRGHRKQQQRSEEGPQRQPGGP